MLLLLLTIASLNLIAAINRLGLYFDSHNPYYKKDTIFNPMIELLCSPISRFHLKIVEYIIKILRRIILLEVINKILLEIYFIGCYTYYFYFSSIRERLKTLIIKSMCHKENMNLQKIMRLFNFLIFLMVDKQRFIIYRIST